jgi:cytidyltransferase-like protein
VVINGAFDLLHVGHMRLIFQAREMAGNKGTLVCALDSDRRIRDSKKGRPILTWVERATALSYMPIDYLIEIDSDEEMKNFLNKSRPNLRVQGGEYVDKASKYPWLKKAYVRSEGMHTSVIIERILKQCKPNS